MTTNERCHQPYGPGRRRQSEQGQQPRPGLDQWKREGQTTSGQGQQARPEDREVGERESKVKISVWLSSNKNHRSKGEIYISLENEAQVKSLNRCIVTK